MRNWRELGERRHSRVLERNVDRTVYQEGCLQVPQTVLAGDMMAGGQVIPVLWPL